MVSHTHSGWAEARIAPGRTGGVLVALLALIGLGHGWALLMIHGVGRDQVFSLVPLLHLDREQNLPTFAAVALLAGCALLLELNRAGEAAERRAGWRLVSLVFGFLALDEFASLHERLDGMIGLIWPDGSAPHGLWILPYLVFGVLLAVYGLRWWRRLDGRTRLVAMLAGLLYLGGAVGMEIAGVVLALSGETVAGAGASLRADLLVTVEEMAELSGAALFLWALIDRLARRGGGVVIIAKCESQNE